MTGEVRFVSSNTAVRTVSSPPDVSLQKAGHQDQAPQESTSEFIEQLHRRGATSTRGSEVYFDAPAHVLSVEDAIYAGMATDTLADLVGAHQKQTASRQRLEAFAQDRASPTLTNLYATLENLARAAVSSGMSFGAFTAVVTFIFNAATGKEMGIENATRLPPDAVSLLKQMGILAGGVVPASLTLSAAMAGNNWGLAPAMRAMCMLATNQDTTIVPVPAHVLFPQPSPMAPDANGNEFPKDPVLYQQELEEMTAGRKKVAQAQGQYGVGTAAYHQFSVSSFGFAHFLRALFVRTYEREEHSLGAGSTVLASALTSASAGAATSAGDTYKKLNATFDDPRSGLKLPLFVTNDELRKMIEDTPSPGRLALARGQFSRDNHFKGVPLSRVIPASLAQAVCTAATLGLTLLVVPWAATAANAAMGDPKTASTGRKLAGDLVQGLLIGTSFLLANAPFFKSVKEVPALFRPDLEKQMAHKMELAMGNAIRTFVASHPTLPEDLQARDGQLSMVQLAELFTLVDDEIRQDLELAVREGRNQHVRPSFDHEVLEKYRLHSVKMRQDLLAAGHFETIPPEQRTAKMARLLHTMTERLQSCSQRVAGHVGEITNHVMTELQHANQQVSAQLQEVIVR